jgi:hypothetical protein
VLAMTFNCFHLSKKVPIADSCVLEQAGHFKNAQRAFTPFCLGHSLLIGLQREDSVQNAQQIFLQKFYSAKKIYSSQTSRSRCFLPTNPVTFPRVACPIFECVEDDCCNRK